MWLNYFYLILCVLSGLSSLWIMQCLTNHSGLSCRHSVAMMALRISMAVLALALFVDAYHVAEGVVYASLWGTLLVLALLVFLFALPIAIGGRKGVEILRQQI